MCLPVFLYSPYPTFIIGLSKIHASIIVVEYSQIKTSEEINISLIILISPIGYFVSKELSPPVLMIWGFIN